MTVDFHKIQWKDLSDFCQSEVFANLNEKPISHERIASYVNNPNALENDYVLYLLTIGTELVAYRSLLPDNLEGSSNQHFAWLSGNYVNPKHRRKGYSKQLLQAAMKDWDNKLMYTNYAPESHALYQSTGKFKIISQRQGKTFYLFTKPSILLKERSSKFIRFFLPLADIGIRLFANMKLWFSNTKAPKEKVQVDKTPSADFMQAFDHRPMLGFTRKSEELNWILNYPWVKEGNNKQNYFFSHHANQMAYYFIHFKENIDLGWAILHERDGMLKVPYYQVTDNKLHAFSQFIVHWASQHKIQQLRIFDSGLAKSISAQRHPFLHSKPTIQNVYASWDFALNELQFSDGDGDYIFT